MNDLRFPIGEFKVPERLEPDDLANWIDVIALLPAEMRAAVQELSEAELETRYRPEGWTARQVVHHVADSHMNSYIRFKLALTEENPTIKPYDEAAWAKLADYRETPVEDTLALLELLHARWVTLLRSMDPEHFRRTFFHPESNRKIRLDVATAFYAWHGRHHVAHVRSIRGD